MPKHIKTNQELIRENFGFLDEKYGLVFDDGLTYESDKIKIFFNPGRRNVGLSIWHKSEPQCTEVGFGWIMKALNVKETYPGNLEENFKLVSQYFRQHETILMLRPHEWLVPTLKMFFEHDLKVLKDMEQVLGGKCNKEIYDYIKSKDSNWNPQV